jgi:beta-glucanase (GH16 family)
MDPTAAGFAQQYGYFEIRAQMPASGTGAWTSFWIMSENSILNNNNGTSLPNEEVDIFEWYGNNYNNGTANIQQASHNWLPTGGPAGLYSPSTPMPGGALPWQGFHIYGAQVDPVHITWYIDGVQTNQIATPPGYITSPFYIMNDYALGGGWPLSGMVNNSSMLVDWIRVYALPSTGSSGSMVSVSLSGSNAAPPLQATDTAGAGSYAAANWNVFPGQSKSTSSLLQDSTGSTTAGLTLSSFNSTAATTLTEPSSPTGDQKLFGGYVTSPYTGLPTVSINGISYPAYNLIVYIEENGSGVSG